MDSLITAAARALAAGDPLGALQRVALRDDAPALALRGIAMAQLGDLARAKVLLRRAARAFGPKEAVARARCVVAEAEIALVSRDLGFPAKALDAARATLEERGDWLNAAHARYLEVRRLLLIGRLDEAERLLAQVDPASFPRASRTAHEPVVVGRGPRRLGRREAGIPVLVAEVEGAPVSPGSFPPASRTPHEPVVAGLAAGRLGTREAGIPAPMAEVEGASVPPASLPPALRTAHEPVVAGLAPPAAPERAAREAGIPALMAGVEVASFPPASFPPAMRTAHELVVAGIGREADTPALAVEGAPFPPASFPPAMRTAHELVVAGIALRRLRTRAARAALDRAGIAAREAGIPALTAEVESAALALNTPAARRIANGEERLLLLEEVEALLASKALVVDACRYAVHDAGAVVSLAKRPVLFALVRALGEAWPGDAPRDLLLTRAFGARLTDESHRARLRVEIGRLRRVLRTMAGVNATKRGFVLAPRRALEVVVLARPVEEEHGAVLAFLADGESWSSSALAMALGTSQRTVQRALDSLAAAGKVQSYGRGRARRWMTPPVPGFTTALLLPAALPID